MVSGILTFHTSRGTRTMTKKEWEEGIAHNLKIRELKRKAEEMAILTKQVEKWNARDVQLIVYSFLSGFLTAMFICYLIVR